MKKLLFYTTICGLLSLYTAAQNNRLKGKILFLNSDKTPAVGVELSGSITTSEGEIIHANLAHSADDGTYTLVFQNAVPGHVAELKVGNTDTNGQALEIVNEEELRICRIPEDPAEEFNIIVCKKGERDEAAQRYYKIIKTFADRGLEKIRKKRDYLLTQKSRDYQKIDELNKEIIVLERQTDSLTIYKEAFRLASINKDNASKRVKNYLKLLDRGKSIQEARKALSIKEVTEDMETGVAQVGSSIRELKIRAEASEKVFEYEDAIACYDTIISYAEKTGVDRFEIARYYTKAATLIFDNGNYEIALEYQQRAIDIFKEIPGIKDLELATAYNKTGTIYMILNRYMIALDYHLKALSIQEEVLKTRNSGMAVSYHNIARIYNILGQYEKTLKYFQKAIAIQKKTLGIRHPDLATSYDNMALTYQIIGQYKKALKYHKKAYSIRKKSLDAQHPDLGVTYMNIASTYTAMQNLPLALSFYEKSLAIFRNTLPKNHPYRERVLSRIGIVRAKNSQFEEAYSIFLVYEKLFPKKGQAWRNWAVYYALQNEKEKALENLKKAVELGYNNLEWLKTDDSMDNLRKEAVFIELLKKLAPEKQ